MATTGSKLCQFTGTPGKWTGPSGPGRRGNLRERATRNRIHPQGINRGAWRADHLFVSASGDNLTYQWKKDGVDLSGENAAALTFEEARPQDSGNYTVVGNADGNVTSSVAQLVVDTLMKQVASGTYRIGRRSGQYGARSPSVRLPDRYV